MGNMDAVPGNKLAHNLNNQEVVINDLDKVINNVNNMIADSMTRKKLKPAEDLVSQLQNTLLILEGLKGKVEKAKN